jgi:hypothetical protein
VFAAIALLLVTLGVYSVLSYLVAQSRRRRSDACATDRVSESVDVRKRSTAPF